AARPEPADRALEAERLRARAEDLAQAASRKFGEVLKEDRLAEAQVKQPATGPADGGGPWSVARRWLDYSNREYRSLMEKLGQGGSRTPGAKPQPGRVATAPAPSGDAGVRDWVTQSGERFQEIMRKLAERAAPPKTEVSREAKPSTPASQGTTGAADRPPEKAPEPTSPKVAQAPAPAVPVPRTEEERKLAETRRAEAAKRETEVKKTEEALKAEQAKKQKHAEAKAAEEARKAEAAKKAEEARKAAEARKAHEAKVAEDAKRAEEARRAAEAKRAAEARAADDARKAEAAKKAAAEAKAAEDARKAREAKAAEDAKRAAEAKR